MTSPAPDLQDAVDFLNQRVNQLTQDLFDRFVEKRRLEARIAELEGVLVELQTSEGAT